VSLIRRAENVILDGQSRHRVAIHGLLQKIDNLNRVMADFLLNGELPKEIRKYRPIGHREGVKEMIDLKQAHKPRKRTKQELIEGMVRTLLDHNYSVNEIMELTCTSYLVEVQGSCLQISDAREIFFSEP